MGERSAFVFGGTGSIGGGIVRALACEPKYSKVTLFGRRPLQFPSEPGPDENYSKFEQKTIDFETLDEVDIELFKGFTVGFYALGVSSAKVNEATYRKVEHDYTVSIGRKLREVGDCEHFNWVSGKGVHKDSWFLFGKVKAQVEIELAEMNFHRLSIFQPGMVLNSDTKTGLCLSKCLDRWNLAIDSNSLGRVIVQNTLQSSDEKVEVINMNQMSKSLKELTN